MADIGRPTVKNSKWQKIVSRQGAKTQRRTLLFFFASLRLGETIDFSHLLAAEQASFTGS